MKKPLSLVMILGSVRPERFCDTVAMWVESQIDLSPDFSCTRVDPQLDWPNPVNARVRRQIGAADAILVVTPEYNHSFPGPLKILIDAVKDEWRIKPVAFVSYGGISGGLRAVEHLRQVFIELNAVPIRDAVSFHNVWEKFTDGRPIEDARYTRSMQSMLARLAQWSRALKCARESESYGEAA